MKKKEYIQPELLVVNISSTEVVCTSTQIIGSGGSNAGTGYNEADASMRRGSDWSDFENY